MTGDRIQEPLGSLLSKTHTLMKNYFNQMIRAHNIDATVDQWVLLTVVHRTPGISQVEISRTSQKDTTNVSRTLDLLAGKGYIKRRADEQDRRAYRVYLTPAGEETLRRVFPIMEAVNEASCEGLEAEQVDMLKAMLSHVRGNVEKKIKGGQ